ncbi:MAG TPA: YihY/virulence factor BrkB family protein [Pseudonocardiaceae bacterium]|nr:YihY/virulence factor BrkB family protein [Pseudonocardiaceae bacterium]
MMSVTGKVRGKLGHLDSYQQKHRLLGVLIAVVRKFFEDQSMNLASMVAFWAFFSVIPLLLAFVTLLGYFLPPGINGAVLTTVGHYLPLVSVGSLGHLSGRWWALILGIVSALFSGSFVVMTAQDALNSVWEIPHNRRPTLAATIKNSLVVLATIGLGLVVSTIISDYLTGTATKIHVGVFGQLAGYLIAVVLDVALFVAAFRILTAREVSTRDVLPGALLSGVAFWVLQQLSSLIISDYLRYTESTYGTFATVITLLWWLYLQSIITLVGAQLNVVLKERLHPRGLVDVPATDADYRAYQAYAQERSYHDQEQVYTDFPPACHRGGLPPLSSRDRVLRVLVTTFQQHCPTDEHAVHERFAQLAVTALHAEGLLAATAGGNE